MDAFANLIQFLKSFNLPFGRQVHNWQVINEQQEKRKIGKLLSLIMKNCIKFL
jgi:hypothetical protein